MKRSPAFPCAATWLDESSWDMETDRRPETVSARWHPGAGACECFLAGRKAAGAKQKSMNAFGRFGWSFLPSVWYDLFTQLNLVNFLVLVGVGSYLGGFKNSFLGFMAMV